MHTNTWRMSQITATSGVSKDTGIDSRNNSEQQRKKPADSCDLLVICIINVALWHDLNTIHMLIILTRR